MKFVLDLLSIDNDNYTRELYIAFFMVVSLVLEKKIIEEMANYSKRQKIAHGDFFDIKKNYEILKTHLDLYECKRADLSKGTTKQIESHKELCKELE